MRHDSTGGLCEVATLAGVVEGTVYAYFESKRALLLRVVSDFYEQLIHDAESGLRAVRGAENQLRFLIARHISVLVEDLGICRIVLSEIRPDPALYGDAVLELNRRYTSLALHVIEEGVASGELHADTVPTVLRDLIYGGIEHALWRPMFAGAEIDAQQLADDLATALLSGALSRPSDDATAQRIERAVAALERRVEEVR